MQADGKDEEVSLEHVHANDLIRVRPGDKIPVDGIITDRPGLTWQVWEEREGLTVLERLLVQLASRLGSDYGEQL